MHKRVQVERDQYTCDGCEYAMSGPTVDAAVRVVVPWPAGNQPSGSSELEFHFHTLHNRHDCFRYWAHSPRIMVRSLKARGLSEAEIDEFLSLMLYREDTVHPGIARPENKIGAA